MSTAIPLLALFLSAAPPTALPEAALARFGNDRLVLFRRATSTEFAADGRELRAFDGRTLYRWELPTGKPLARANVPESVNAGGRPFVCAAISPRSPRVAWVRFADGKERLQVFDAAAGKLVLDRAISLTGDAVDYAGLAWSDDGSRLAARTTDGRAFVFDLDGKPIEKLDPAVLRGWDRGGYVQGGSVTAGRVRIAAEFDKAGLERDRSGPRLILTFTDLATGKKDELRPTPALDQPGYAVASRDGKLVAVACRDRLRVWDVAGRRELPFGDAFGEARHLVVSGGGGFVQFQRDPVQYAGTPWLSLDVSSGKVRPLAAPATTGVTLGLGTAGFAEGQDRFVGVTGRSLDRWDLRTGRRLDGVSLPETPREDDAQIGYDECVLWGGGFGLTQFACVVRKERKGDDVYRPTWRSWTPTGAEEKEATLAGFTWQRGAAALPGRRALFFATPFDTTKSDTVQPGVTIKTRGESKLYFADAGKPDSVRPAAFAGTWGEFRGVSRGGHLVLVSAAESTWVQGSRTSQSTWYDPAAQTHALIEYHSGEPACDGKALAAVVRDRASHLSADGRYVLVGGEGALLVYEPFVTRRVVKEIALPATPVRFASDADGGRVSCQLDDGTLVVFDGARLAKWADDAVAKEVPKDPARLVVDLSGRPEVAMRAARLLSAAGAAGVAAVRTMDTKRPTAAEVAALIRGLDADEFAVRESSQAALARWGGDTAKALKDASAAKPSREQARRLRALLARFARCPLGDAELALARAAWATDGAAGR